MRLRIEVTETDITRSKAHPWLEVVFRRCPIYRAIVRQTGYPHLEVETEWIRLHTGGSHNWSNPRGAGLVYALPPEAVRRRQLYYEGKIAHRDMEPFSFDVELDVRGAKLLSLQRPCLRCGDYPRETGHELCTQCQAYRGEMQQYWR